MCRPHSGTVAVYIKQIDLAEASECSMYTTNCFKKPAGALKWNEMNSSVLIMRRKIQNCGAPWLCALGGERGPAGHAVPSLCTRRQVPDKQGPVGKRGVAAAAGQGLLEEVEKGHRRFVFQTFIRLDWLKEALVKKLIYKIIKEFHWWALRWW